MTRSRSGLGCVLNVGECSSHHKYQNPKPHSPTYHKNFVLPYALCSIPLELELESMKTAGELKVSLNIKIFVV
jgi:hypothetical protein